LLREAGDVLEIGAMFQILLIRAGETEYDQQGRIQGTLDIPLSEDGRRQAEALIEPLRSQPLVAIYSSPSESAQQTAEILGAALDRKVKTIDKLENLNHGLWQGMLVTDVKTKQPRVYRQWQEQPETVCPPQGESVNAAEERIQTAIAKLMKKHKSEGLIAIVLPEPLATVLCHLLRQDELGDLWRSRDGAAAWETIDVTPEAVGSK
jgi:probable phosphoglycerate mutase